jgi:carbon-monoxide dehydrogenase medium subunit
VAVDDFFTGFLETALAPDELLIEVRIPRVPDARWSFQKFNRRAQDWAIVGAAVLVAEGNCGVGLVNMDARPVRAVAVEAAVNSGASATVAAEAAPEGLEPPGDLNASPEYRCHLARVLTRRGLEQASR